MSFPPWRYGGGFQWNNSPRGSSLGASVSNNLTLNNTIKIDVQDIFSRLDFLAKMKNADVGWFVIKQLNEGRVKE